MYKLLIVEDEEIIREGLVATICWNDYGFEVVAVAEDGQAALEKYGQYSPDVVLTDIKMPIMDGLELLKAIRMRSTSTEVVLISGFKEFEYAKKGMEYSAYAYILKESLHEEIARVFPKLCEKLSDKAEDQRQLRNLMSIQNYMQLGKNEGWKATGLSGSFFCVLVLWLPRCVEDGFLDLVASEQSLLCVKDSYLICTYSTQTKQQMEFHIKKMSFKILQHAQSLGFTVFTLGIGSIKDSADQITYSYREAMKSVDWGRIYPTLVSRYDTIISQLRPQREKPDLNNYESYIMLNKKASLIQLINSICYDYIHTNGDLIPDLNLLCGDIISRFFFYIENYELFKDYIKRLLNYACTIDSYIEYNDWMVEEIAKLCDILEHDRNNNRMQGISRVIQLVDRGFQSGISLENASEFAFMTPSHFSAKFKEFTGKTFSVYLRKKRIEHACKLLQTTELRVYEVSKQCGYDDEKYFCRVFKLETGTSPNQYKQNAIV